MAAGQAGSCSYRGSPVLWLEQHGALGFVCPSLRKIQQKAKRKQQDQAEKDKAGKGQLKLVESKSHEGEVTSASTTQTAMEEAAQRAAVS